MLCSNNSIGHRREACHNPKLHRKYPERQTVILMSKEDGSGVIRHLQDRHPGIAEADVGEPALGHPQGLVAMNRGHHQTSGAAALFMASMKETTMRREVEVLPTRAQEVTVVAEEEGVVAEELFLQVGGIAVRQEETQACKSRRHRPGIPRCLKFPRMSLLRVILDRAVFEVRETSTVNILLDSVR